MLDKYVVHITKPPSDLTNLEHGALFGPEADGPLSAVLSEDDLHVEEGQRPEAQHQEVRDQEGGAAVLFM